MVAEFVFSDGSAIHTNYPVELRRILNGRGMFAFFGIFCSTLSLDTNKCGSKKNLVCERLKTNSLTQRIKQCLSKKNVCESHQETSRVNCFSDGN